LLLPFLMLKAELSSKNDKHQRDMRSRLRMLENDLSGRYKDGNKRGPKPPEDANIRKLDTINRDLTDCHCQVLWKRPQAWQLAVKGLTTAAAAFWEHLPANDQPQFSAAHEFIMSGLDLLKVKCEGMESYTHVTLERLNLQREVVRCLTDFAVRRC
jgi:hypothetical protein